MHNEKISEIIAHFIGLFDTAVDDARLRNSYAEGAGPRDTDVALSEDQTSARPFVSNLELKDYDPSVDYQSVSYNVNFTHARFFGHAFEETLARLNEIAHRDFSGLHFRGPHSTIPGEESELPIFQGPGSEIAHAAQANILNDDDYLNMTDREPEFRDTSFVTERTMEFTAKAEVFTPFSALDRTDTHEGLKAIADEVHEYIRSVQDNGITAMDSSAQQNVVLTGEELQENTFYVNGQAVDTAPVLEDFMPDRGIAKPAEEPEKSDVPLEQHGETGNSLDVAAGANVLANIVSITDTSIIASVTAVMGNYHQIDVITQSYVYSDQDCIGSAFNRDDSSATVANNIAAFQRSVYDTGQPQQDAGDHDPIFPTAWRVSVVDGDVSFVNWIEQYHFISDNDTMTITTTGTETTVLTGGNAALNFASIFGMGMQYDLIIVGGNVLDMNIISQISVLYDNDWARGDDGTQPATIQSGNNLIWNLAQIHNVGAQDRFQDMPDYMVQTQKAIEDRDPSMPAGLSHDSNFEGYAGLNVLYITGNLYDVNVVKQVSVLGDSDDVTQVVSNILENNQNATIHVDTGSNAVVNIAQIMDYDTFGHTTYLAGQLYSDAILIQGGIIEQDNSEAHPSSDRLANEVIAFLHDDAPSGSGSDDVTINAGHDLSWALAHPADVMQTVVA